MLGLSTEAVYHNTKLRYKSKGNFVQVSLPFVREFQVDKRRAVLIPMPEAYHRAAMIYSCRFLHSAFLAVYNFSLNVKSSSLLPCFIAFNGLRLFTMEILTVTVHVCCVLAQFHFTTLCFLTLCHVSRDYRRIWPFDIVTTHFTVTHSSVHSIVTCTPLVRRVLVWMIGFIITWITHSLVILDSVIDKS
jgi:hypothetical protein